MPRRFVLLSSVAASSLLLSAYAWQQRGPLPGVMPTSFDTPTSVASPLDDHMAHMPASELAAGVAAAGTALAQPDNPKYPASSANVAARLAATPRHGEWVKFPSALGASDSIMAWVVYPTTTKRAPVVVVVHEIFGLSSWVRGVADQVASEGFIAIAPDFLSRARGGPSSEELPSDKARGLIGGVDAAERNRVILAAANYAMLQPAAEQRYAVIGYCWGGQTTFMHAIHGGVKGFAGGVAFYGVPYITGGTPATATTEAVPASVSADSLAKINTPILLLNGSKDARIGAVMPALDSIMKAKKKSYAGVNYPGATHGFLRAQGDPKTVRDEAEEQANLAATADGWPKTIAFLKQHLRVK